MDKRLKITEIAARTQLSISTVSRVLAGKANTSEKARAKVLACARELGVMDGMAAGRLLLNSLGGFCPAARLRRAVRHLLLPRDPEREQRACLPRGPVALLRAGGERQRRPAVSGADERAGHAGGHSSRY